MSGEQPNPYALSPEQYSKNRAVIEGAQARIAEMARMNEIGRINFEQLEREERELNQRIEDGRIAEQQRRQLLQLKALALSNTSNTLRIEGPGSSNFGTSQENASIQQKFASYPQQGSQLGGVPTSGSYIQGPSYSNQAPQQNQNSQAPYTSHTHNTFQTQYSAQTSVYSQPAQPPVSSSFPSQQATHVSQAQTSSTQVHQQSYSNQSHRNSYEAPYSSTSSLVGALGPNDTTNQPVASSSRVTHQNTGSSWTTAPVAAGQSHVYPIPDYPTAANIKSIQEYLITWAAGVVPQTMFTGVLAWRTYRVKCYKNTDGLIDFAVETPNGLLHANWFIERLMEAAASGPPTSGQSASDSRTSRSTVRDPVQNLTTATLPSVRNSGPTSGTHPTANQTVAAAASSSTAQNIANGQRTVTPVPRITKPQTQPSASSERNITNLQNQVSSIARTPAAPSSSTANLQTTSSSSVSNPSSAAPTVAVPIPTNAEQQIIPSPAVGTPARPAFQVPAAFSSPGKMALTPAEQSTAEGSTGPISTPKQADGKRLARDLLRALGKRSREGSSDADSQSSKRHASTAVVQAQAASNQGQPPPGSLQNGQTLNSNIARTTSSHIQTPSSNVSQNPAQPYNVGFVPHASVVTNPTVSSQQPSQSYTQPVPDNSTSSAPSTHYSKYYPRAAYHPSLPSSVGQPQVRSSLQNSFLGTQIVPYGATNSINAYLGTAKTGFNQPQTYQIPTEPQLVPIPGPTTVAQRSTTSQSNLSAPPLTSAEVGSKSTVNSKVDLASTATPAKLGDSQGSKGTTNSKVDLASRVTPAKSNDAQISSFISAIVASQNSGAPNLTAQEQSEPSTSKQVSHNEEPLFLPSSSPESGASFSRTQSETHEAANVIKSKKDIRRKGNRAYVLLPRAPDYLVRHREQMRASSVKAGKQRETVPSVSAPASIVDEEEIWYALESQRNSDPGDENEREAVRLSCSRLQASPCRWDACNAVMNSGEALIRHLNLHKPEPSHNIRTYMCRWTQCGQQGVHFGDSQHLRKHALSQLRCAYLDCKEWFRSGGQLLKHHRKKHTNGTLKPSTKPEAPTTDAALPKIPAPFPSYLLSTDLARGEVLSKEKHQLIGRQVLMNITFCDDGAPLKRRSKKTARPASRQTLPDPTADLTNDYQFLTAKNSARSSTYFSKACDIDHADLPSAEISRMVEQGVVFWGSDDEADNDGGPSGGLAAAPDSQLFSQVGLQEASHAEIKLEAGAGPSYDRSASVGGQNRHDEVLNSDVEDAAVETMLTDLTLTQH